MNKRDLWIYRIATGIFSLMILMGVGMYLFQHDKVVGMYEAFGYPSYIIYPLAAAKVLGVVAIWTKKSKVLKEWAYAGFVFELILGAGAHIAIQDGEAGGALFVLVLVLVSYFYDRKLYA